MANPWFKFYASDYLNEPKMHGMDGNTRSCWLTLLCYASISEVPGVIDLRYVTEDLVLLRSGVPMGGSEWEKMTGVFERFLQKEMVFKEGDCLHVKSWMKRQESYLTGAERGKRHRDNQKDEELHEGRVTNVTLDKNRTDKNRTDKTLFERIWASYPKRVGKAEALKAFEKLPQTEELAAAIVSSIAAHKRTSQWKDNDGRYIPHLSTFLNQKRYEDEVMELAKASVIKL
jgi:hypothetical protein